MSIRSRTIELFILILAGEMIFSLPFHIARFFRPTFLSAFDLSNTQLGDMFALYGIIAMLSYFPGGWLADRLSNRLLMSIALWLTALGGLYLSSFPGSAGMSLLFAYWGMTTILLFWSALIRVTRMWGGQFMQGRAFGLLDGGRGLAAAGFATLLVWLIRQSISFELDQFDDSQRIAALQTIIYFYSAITAGTGILIWLLPKELSTPNSISIQNSSPRHTFNYQELKFIGLQAMIIICAYCGYKGLDYYGWYLHQVLGYSELESAQYTSIGAYIRPIAAVAAGVIADRFITSKSIGFFFILLLSGYLLLAATDANSVPHGFLILNLLFTAIIVLGIRGVYFALLQESGIPAAVTGTAAGIVSVIGFTPDIFFASIAGRILDGTSGPAGFQYFFWWLTSIACVGAITTFILNIAIRNNPVRS